MIRFGFGLERIGLLALSRPRLFTVLVLLVTALLGMFVPSVKFDGNVTAVIPRTSESFLAYEQQHRDFRNFSRDVALIVRSPRLHTAKGLEDLRIMQLDLSIADGVVGAFSMFSIPDMEEGSEEIGRFFPAQIESDAEADALLDRLLKLYPQASNLISLEEDAVLLLVALDIEPGQGNNKETFDLFRSVVAEVDDIKPDDFEVLFAGLTPISITILDTLIKDQVRLTLLGLLAGAIVAFLFFRCIASAILCAIPPVLTAVWSIGFFGMANIPITYLTTILPTLALILAYADGIVMHHRWSRLNRRRAKTRETYFENLKEAVSKVGPASALTSVTTGVAIGSFALSRSEALTEFAWIGVVLVLLAFLSVIVALPVFGYWFATANLLRTTRPSARAKMVGWFAHRAYSTSPVAISLAALVVVGGLFYTHSKLEPDYRITDYLPRDSATLEAERMANDVFGGRSLVFFSVPVAEDGGVVSAKNRERLGEVTQVLEAAFDERKVFSLHSFLKRFDEAAVARFAPRLQDAPEEVRQGYISGDDQKMLVSLRVPSSQSTSESVVLLDELRNALSSLAYADDIIITGFPILLAVEFTEIINELRTSLLLAIVVGIVLIGIATRSLFFAAAAALPNLFPVLFVEALIYLQGGQINVTEVIALTIAFGIAIDNAVHVINVYRANMKKEGAISELALKGAVSEVAPALCGSALIICTATSVILISTLPILPIIGKLIIVILAVALVTNLILLPANIVALRKLLGRET